MNVFTLLALLFTALAMMIHASSPTSEEDSTEANLKELIQNHLRDYIVCFDSSDAVEGEQLFHKLRAMPSVERSKFLSDFCNGKGTCGTDGLAKLRIKGSSVNGQLENNTGYRCGKYV